MTARHGLHEAAQLSPHAKPVAKVLSWTNSSYGRNYTLQWFTSVPEGALLYAASQTVEPKAVKRQPLSVPAISHCINQTLGGAGREQMRQLARLVERQCALAWGVDIQAAPAPPAIERLPADDSEGGLL